MRVEVFKSRSLTVLCDDINERIKVLEDEGATIYDIIYSTVYTPKGTEYTAMLVTSTK